MIVIIPTVLALVFCAALGFSALTYAFFWYEACSSSYRGYLDQALHGRTGRAMVKVILRSTWHVILIIVFYPIGLLSRLRRPAPNRTCALPAVILVHGLYHNASAWVMYQKWLREAGFENLYDFSYSSWRLSFHEILERLDHKITEVVGLLAGKPVILVGHSMGGLLSRAYVECIGNGWKVESVVTLGAPHQGSKLAALGMGKLAQSLMYRGELISRLEKESKHPGVPRLAIYSPLDNMVLPNEALRVPYDGWDYRECDPMNHVGMLFHKPTAQTVIDFVLNSIARTKEKVQA